jgi:anaerobic dimethyl sulfoxide reductase subunit C (anchor subunit)
MDVREWTLITFTILAQMSVGAFLVLGIAHYYATRKAGMEEADRLSDRTLPVIFAVLGLGMLASLLHLGKPLNAPRAITNLGTSWLSREVLFGVIFAVLGAVFAFLQWRKIGSFALRNVVAWVVAIVGVALVFSMSMVYMLPTQPAWNTLATPISFFTTTLLLGALSVGSAFVVNYAYIQKKNPGCADAQCQLLRDMLRWIAIASVVLVGIKMVVIPIYVAYLSTAGAAAQASAKLMIGSFGLPFVLRSILAFVGASVFGLFLYQTAQEVGKEKSMGYLAYGAFALVLIAEVLGRYVFYSTHIGIGL